MKSVYEPTFLSSNTEVLLADLMVCKDAAIDFIAEKT